MSRARETRERSRPTTPSVAFTGRRLWKLDRAFRASEVKSSCTRTVGVAARIVIGDVDVQLRRLQDERDACACGSCSSQRKRAVADRSVTEQHVPVAVGAQLAGTVVQMERTMRSTPVVGPKSIEDRP